MGWGREVKTNKKKVNVCKRAGVPERTSYLGIHIHGMGIYLCRTPGTSTPHPASHRRLQKVLQRFRSLILVHRRAIQLPDLLRLRARIRDFLIPLYALDYLRIHDEFRVLLSVLEKVVRDRLLGWHAT